MGQASLSRRDSLLRTASLMGGLAAFQQAPPLLQPADAKGRATFGVAKRVPDRKIADDEYSIIKGTDPPMGYYDLKGAGSGSGGIRPGQRVAVHYDLKWRGITVGTSRQGMGVTGGTPYGFDFGVAPGQPGGPFIKAFNVGMAGMQAGTLRRLKVPPEYAYGNKGVQEIPPNSEIILDIELLSVNARPS